MPPPPSSTAAQPMLDPPAWFWRVIDTAQGDPARLRTELQALDQDGLALFYGYLRDLATRLTGTPYTCHLPAEISDETAFEVGAWVVTQGREQYRRTVQDPAAAMPRESLPGTRAQRSMLGVPGEVYAALFGDELPTDVGIQWRPDGSAEPQ